MACVQQPVLVVALRARAAPHVLGARAVLESVILLKEAQDVFA